MDKRQVQFEFTRDETVKFLLKGEFDPGYFSSTEDSCRCAKFLLLEVRLDLPNQPIVQDFQAFGLVEEYEVFTKVEEEYEIFVAARHEYEVTLAYEEQTDERALEEADARSYYANPHAYNGVSPDDF